MLCQKWHELCQKSFIRLVTGVYCLPFYLSETALVKISFGKSSHFLSLFGLKFIVLNASEASSIKLFTAVINPVLLELHFGRLQRPVWWTNQEILKGEISLYRWPPVWLVWNQLYDNWQYLCFFAKWTNPNSQTGDQWYSDTSPFSIPWTNVHA
jgi:hypothetical protein